MPEKTVPVTFDGQKIYATRLFEQNRRLETATGHKRNFYILTFGCQQNEADSEKLAGMASSCGFSKVERAEDADLIIVNTCAVREHAEQKALSLIGQFKHLKAKNPALVICVCGCMATEEHRQNYIKHSFPYVDLLFGTASLHRFPELLCRKLEAGGRMILPSSGGDHEIAEGVPIERESAYRAWVSIMYGCNNFCSYCIVPYVRGRERSRDRDAVVAETEKLAREGYRDITLLGQNVNSYSGGCTFAALLDRLSDIEGDFLLHFMTSHPKDVSDELISVMAEKKKIAKHFHLPLQSGSDRVLRLMNRRYDLSRYLETVDRLRSKMPDIAITSDIIVGFPGESDEDFEETMKVLEKVRFDMVFSFIYSPRVGTPAAEMADQVPDKIKSERFSRMLEFQNNISKDINQKYVGKTMRVLCDGESKNNPDMQSGRTEQNKIVLFHGDGRRYEGGYENIKITRADAFAMYGEPENARL